MSTQEMSPSATRIRVAEIPPVACASCFGQYPQRMHVDFGASYEGPVLGPQEGVMGGKPVSIDDLIICDECLLAAAKLMGFGDTREDHAEIAQLKEELHEQLERANALEHYAKTLEAAVGQRRSLDEVNEPSERVPKPRRR